MAQPVAEEQTVAAQQLEAEPPPQSHVAAVAAAAAAAALVTGAPSAPTAPSKAAVRAATKTLLDGVDALFRARRHGFATYITTTAQHQMPGIGADRVSMLAAEEMRNEAEFQRKQRQRLAEELPQALLIADPAKRAEAVANILEREKRYIGQREQAAAQRLVAALEDDLLKAASPLGAYWKLSPLVREHCLRCLAMAGKFWPWEVLEAHRMPVHPNCQCSKLSLDEAVNQGLMTQDQIPAKGDAIALATRLMSEAGRLEEALTHEEQHELVSGMELQVVEASLREILRWGKGTEHGGEFKPKSGGNPGAAVQKAAHQLRFETAPAASGRTVKLKGESHWIPKGEDWQHKIGSNEYSSPWGTTRIYRNGQLLSQSHHDLTGTTPIATKPHDGGPSFFPELGSHGFVGPYVPPPEPKITPRPAPKGLGKVGIPDYSGRKLEIGKSAGGSTGAKWAFDKKGNRWLVKTYKGNQDRVASELLANAIYRDLGAKVAPAGTYYAKLDGKPIVALTYPTLEGEIRKINSPSRDLGKHYMADALVANWDFVGLADDNVLWGPDGKPARLDQGGTFQFRAQGAPKPYGGVPTEAWTMLQPKGQGFGKVDVSESEMRGQAAKIAETLTPTRIKQLVMAAPFADTKMAGEVEAALRERVQWMRDFSTGDVSLPQPLTGGEIGKQLHEHQRNLGASPEQHNALARYTSDEALQRRMQERLRAGEKLSLVQNEMRKGIDNLLGRAATPEDLTVYRTMDPGQLGDLSKLEGKIVKDKGFGGATSSRAAASAAPGMLQIHVPAGSRVLHVHSLEGVDKTDPHSELMLPRGSRMRVKEVERRGSKTIVHTVLV
jgi:hypothetical protein